MSERERYDLSEALNHIDPRDLNYQEWLEVGMALKHEGFPAEAWDEWSQRDGGRYHPGECRKKWNGFTGSGQPVTGGTLVQLAGSRPAGRMKTGRWTGTAPLAAVGRRPWWWTPAGWKARTCRPRPETSTAGNRRGS